MDVDDGRAAMIGNAVRSHPTEYVWMTATRLQGMESMEARSSTRPALQCQGKTNHARVAILVRHLLKAHPCICTWNPQNTKILYADNLSCRCSILTVQTLCAPRSTASPLHLPILSAIETLTVESDFACQTKTAALLSVRGAAGSLLCIA